MSPKKILSISSSLTLILPYPANSIEHIVKRHDTLSEIAKHYFPNERVYGSRGSLKRILELNKDIADKDLILVGEIIVVDGHNNGEVHPDTTNHKDAKNEDIGLTEDTEGLHEKSEPHQIYSRRLSSIARFGSWYLSVDQRGDGQVADLGGLFFNSYEFDVLYEYKNMSIRLEVNNRNIEYEHSQLSKKSSLFNSRLSFDYNSIRLFTSVNEAPFLTNSNGVNINSQRYVNIGIGYDYRLTQNLVISSLLAIPSSLHIDDSIKDESGYMLEMYGIYTAQFYSSEKYDLIYDIKLSAGYSDINRTVQLNPRSFVEVNSKSINSEIYFGLGIQSF